VGLGQIPTLDDYCKEDRQEDVIKESAREEEQPVLAGV
jgi:hypothetical protein